MNDVSGAGSLTVKQRMGRVLFPRMPITRFLFDQLRVEANAAVAWMETSMAPGVRRRLKAIRNARGLLVNVACGPQAVDGFLNIDLFPARPEVLRWDCRRGLPLSEGSARGIKIEHFVEHLETREELPLVLNACHRALAPGGVLRIAVPDAERFIRAYCNGGPSLYAELGLAELPSDLPTKIDVLNNVFHQGHEHRWGYDYVALADRLSRAGFSTIERSSFGNSRLPELGLADLPMHEPYSLYVEAVR